jgi:isopenicillin N synthase-like dioxygenase
MLMFSVLVRYVTEEFGRQASKVTYLLLDLMAASLGIPQEGVNDLLNDRQKKPVNARIRVNNYPICEHPELTCGIGPHTDPDVITLVHPDSVGGLQIRFKDGTWRGVEPKPGAFVINCGDWLQVLDFCASFHLLMKLSLLSCWSRNVG